MAAEFVDKVLAVVWVFGAIVSAMCLTVQLTIYAYLPYSRKLDLKILTQITVARLVNVIVEIIIGLDLILAFWVRCLVFTLYFQSDCALVCWMFVFSKNLYDKVVQVFTTKKITFVVKSVLVWFCSLVIAACGVTVLALVSDYYGIFYKCYSAVKFMLLIMNILFFCRIFYIAVKRRVGGSTRWIIRMCVISFLLVSISSLQVFLTDLSSFFEENSAQVYFAVVNSYQVLPIMVIFVNLVRGFSGEGGRKISRTIHSAA